MDLEEETFTDIYGYIYKITFPNGKFYIGQTVNIEERWKTHKKNSKNENHKEAVYNAMRKYGIDKVIFEVIDQAETKEDLSNLEILYIFEYNTYKNGGYNMTYGGDGASGYKFTEEQLKRHKETMNKPEIRKKLSEKTKEYFSDPKKREEQSERTKKWASENKDKLSERMLKFHQENPDAGKKHGERMKKLYEEEPERKEKMSELKKQQYKDNPDLRKKSVNKKHQNKPSFNAYKDGQFIGKFDYQFEAKDYIKDKYDIKLTPCYVLSGKVKSAKGFTFKYIEAENRGESSSGMSAEERDELDELNSVDED